MDPNVALTRLRALVDRVEHATTNDAEHDAATDLVEQFQALDEWLGKAGFLPAEWAAATAAPPATGDALSDMLQGLSARFEAERKQGAGYQALLAERSLYSMLRLAEMHMTAIALDVSAVLKDKYGIRLHDADRWRRLLGLARWRSELESEFAKETHVGSVDRAFAAIVDDLNEEKR